MRDNHLRGEGVDRRPGAGGAFCRPPEVEGCGSRSVSDPGLACRCCPSTAPTGSLTPRLPCADERPAHQNPLGATTRLALKNTGGHHMKDDADVLGGVQGAALSLRPRVPRCLRALTPPARVLELCAYVVATDARRRLHRRCHPYGDVVALDGRTKQAHYRVITFGAFLFALSAGGSPS